MVYCKKDIMDLSEFGDIDLKDVLKQSRDQNPFEHDDLTKRIRRTLYYDPLKRPDMDTLSFSITKSAVSCFRNAAPMPMRKLGHRYASRVARDACISPCALLLGLIYIERLKHKNPSYLKKITSSDLFLISMMVASKYLYDEGSEDEVFNDEWALSGDMEVEKVNKLEADFLGAIDWHLYVHPYEFSSMLNIAETDIALSNGCKRGWLTYSDLRSLLDCHSVYKQLYQTAGILSKATCMCMIMYSGLVCLAAFSSAALVSVTQLATCGGAMMGPHLPKNPSSMDGDNNTTHETDKIAGPISEDEVVELLQASHPDFVLVSSPILADPNTTNDIHTREKPPPRTVPDDPHLKNESQISSLALSLEDPPDDPAPKRNPLPSKPIIAILEAAFLMAHLPAICPPKTIERKDVCKLSPLPTNQTTDQDWCPKCNGIREVTHRTAQPDSSTDDDVHSGYGNRIRHRRKPPSHPHFTASKLGRIKLPLDPPAWKPPFRHSAITNIAGLVH